MSRRILGVFYLGLLELIRSAVFIFFGSSICAQNILKRNLNDNSVVCIGWGVAYFISSIIAINKQGSSVFSITALYHFWNKKISKGEFFLSIIGQVVGAFVGACLAWALVYEAVFQLDKGNHMLTGPLRTAQIFAGYPSLHQSTINAFFAEIVSSFLFVFIISVVENSVRNVILSKFIHGVTLIIILLSLDFNSTTTINPAREIGSRAASYIFGYNEKVFSFRSSKWLLIVTMGPVLGSLLAMCAFNLLRLCSTSKKVNNVRSKGTQASPHVYGVHFDNLHSRML
ncbi:unnamed protein product [Bursaphelenchus xylophilus]|uniref:(pine wood nematode) hypothetical protein n=1 Tax=Bursaphelenchus xylophilus TaxID=6326 RepID=A0A1I7SFQ6_BURXY|nr:unnamed protein product [Bursaphelenchus xylophilus]CAG9123684.1 unnamed protein product [Bursaphelenchus xylophilus]